tara:strand:+ start:231 stop:431 length:201 start_codon:yes stop_codon:yes gene_type:complete
MKKEKTMFLPITVHGEDVIIDYFKKDIVFPNRNDDSDFDMEKAANIAVYLKEEGFLEYFDEVERVD